MDEIKSEYVSVKREYLKTVECGAELAEYRRGYIQGLSEGIGYAERLIRAMQGRE